jgi:hypothetical protein
LEMHSDAPGGYASVTEGLMSAMATLANGRNGSKGALQWAAASLMHACSNSMLS